MSFFISLSSIILKDTFLLRVFLFYQEISRDSVFFGHLVLWLFRTIFFAIIACSVILYIISCSLMLDAFFSIEGCVKLWVVLLGESLMSALVTSILEFLWWSRITNHKLLTTLECKNHKRLEEPNWQVNTGGLHIREACSMCWSVQKNCQFKRSFHNGPRLTHYALNKYPEDAIVDKLCNYQLSRI